MINFTPAAIRREDFFYIFVDVIEKEK